MCICGNTYEEENTKCTLCGRVASIPVVQCNNCEEWCTKEDLVEGLCEICSQGIDCRAYSLLYDLKGRFAGSTTENELTKDELKQINVIKVKEPREGYIYHFEFKTLNRTDILQSYTVNDDYGYAECLVYKSTHATQTRQACMIDHLSREIIEINKGERKDIWKYEEMPTTDFPYVIHLVGCDDSSYSKYVATLEEANRVVEILIEDKKPTCTSQLIDQLAFTFTN